MRDYAELIQTLRYCAEHDNCGTQCPRFSCTRDCEGDQLTDAADAIEELLAKVPTWISVEDRLPKPGERVLITNGSFVCESYQSQGKRWMRHGCYMDYMQPTHWMPLPTPPKGVE